MNKAILSLLVLATVFLVACSGTSQTGSGNVEVSQDGDTVIVEDHDSGSVVEVENAGDEWCAPGSVLRSQFPGQAGAGLQGTEVSVVGKETISIGGIQVETCHMQQEFTGGGYDDALSEVWASEDEKFFKTKTSSGGVDLVVETWEANGESCTKMYGDDGSVLAESCQAI